jgi:hypothetical protein
MDEYPHMYFNYEGKRLIQGVQDLNRFDVDEEKVRQLEANNFTVKKMWAFQKKKGDPQDVWSFMELCENEPNTDGKCLQRIAHNEDGSPEQVAINPAYQRNYMTNHEGPHAATPKYYGRTFRKQFETAFDNRGIPMVLIMEWNSWTHHIHNTCDYGGGRTDEHCMVDGYDIEYNRDIEAAKDELGAYYYRLMKGCIELYNSGKDCSSSPDDICCKDHEKFFEVYGDVKSYSVVSNSSDEEVFTDLVDSEPIPKEEDDAIKSFFSRIARWVYGNPER